MGVVDYNKVSGVCYRGSGFITLSCALIGPLCVVMCPTTACILCSITGNSSGFVVQRLVVCFTCLTRTLTRIHKSPHDMKHVL